MSRRRRGALKFKAPPLFAGGGRVPNIPCVPEVDERQRKTTLPTPGIFTRASVNIQYVPRGSRETLRKFANDENSYGKEERANRKFKQTRAIVGHSVLITRILIPTHPRARFLSKNFPVAFLRITFCNLLRPLLFFSLSSKAATKTNLGRNRRARYREPSRPSKRKIT